ncbi:hypothetical protein SLA2020_075440 [Shorea laevis]
MKKLNHFSHPHPLVLVEDQEIDWISIIYYCSACHQRVEGSSYNCTECDFCLHKSCAELQREINHPFHPSHPLILYEKGCHQYPGFISYGCNSCRKSYKSGEELFFYHCSSCKFDLDVRCALLPNLITGDFPKRKHFSHQHSLFFIQNHYIEPQDRSCSACEEPISGPVYCCFDCLFFLHQKCFELPSEIKHPSHRKHSLTLLPNPLPHPEKCSCHLCTKAYKGFIYYCSLCEFGIMIKYIFSEHKVIKNKHHEHPFTLVARSSIPFICDACGTDGEYCIPYVCTTCDIVVHKDCTSLPRNILITRHDHPVSHSYYFFEEKEVKKRGCRICQNEINAEYGCYHCPGCDYFVHVDCAMDKDIFIQEYEVTDENQNLNQINLGWLIGEPSITRVLKEKKIGEEVIAIEIEHFNHGCKLILCAQYKYDEHPLVLTPRDDIHHHSDQCVCDICEESRDPNEWFYYCGICDNSAHFLCVLGKNPFLKLGKTHKYDFHEHPLTFAKEDYFHYYLKCSNCDKYCKEVFLKCTQSGCKYAIDYECRKHIWRSKGI